MRFCRGLSLDRVSPVSLCPLTEEEAAHGHGAAGRRWVVSNGRTSSAAAAAGAGRPDAEALMQVATDLAHSSDMAAGRSGQYAVLRTAGRVTCNQGSYRTTAQQRCGGAWVHVPCSL